MSNPYYRSSREEYPNPFATTRKQSAPQTGYNHQYQPQQQNGNGYHQNQQVEEDFGSAAQQFHHRQNSLSNGGDGRQQQQQMNGNAAFNNNHQFQEKRQNSDQSYRPPISNLNPQNGGGGQGQFHSPYPNQSPYHQPQPQPQNLFNPISGHSSSYAYAPQSNLTPSSNPNPLYSSKNGDASSVSLQSLYDQEYLKPFNPNSIGDGGLRPPNPSYSNPGIERPQSPFDGVYEDRAPKWEKLNPEQKKIAKEFPKDLDDEGTSLWNSMKGILKNWRSFIKWKYTGYYIILLVILALVALMTIYHTQIIDWLTPVSKKIKSVSWGWVIPVAILFVVSFPPLFGAEVVIILCGVVYGLWIGFAIVSLGTLLGELGNFWAFMYCLKRTAEKYERKNLNYACMAHITREGGFMVILLARLSAIPGHFTTAVFATVGMNVFIFILAAVLSMPKQLSIVYLGVAIEQSGSGGESTTSKIIKYVVLVISFIITVWAAWYLYGKMEQARPIVQKRLRARRYTMLSEARKIEKASENTISYEGEQISATNSNQTINKPYGNGGDSEDEDDDGGMTMKMKIRENHQDVPRSASNGGGGWKWPGSGGGMKSPRAEEENKESHGILREAAPIDRSSQYENGSSSSGSRSISPHNGFISNDRHHHQQQQANGDERERRKQVLELDLEVLREATSPKSSNKNQQSQIPLVNDNAVNTFSPTPQRPGQGQDGNGLERNKSYRYATEIGSIYDFPMNGSEDLGKINTSPDSNSNSNNKFQYHQDGTPVIQSPPSYQDQNQNTSSSRPIQNNQPHRLDTTLNGNAGWNTQQNVLREEDEFQEPIEAPRWSRIEGPSAL